MGELQEITIDLVLRARAKMAEERVNGPGDSVVTEMIFMGQVDAPSSWGIVKRVFQRKPDAEPKRGTKSYRATCAQSKRSTTCVILRSEKEKESEGWKQLRVGEVGLDASKKAADE